MNAIGKTGNSNCRSQPSPPAYTQPPKPGILIVGYRAELLSPYRRTVEIQCRPAIPQVAWFFGRKFLLGLWLAAAVAV